MGSFLEIGRIAKVHGLKGRLKVTAIPGQDCPIKTGDEVFISSPDKREQFVVKNVIINCGYFLLELEGIKSVEAAQRLIGSVVAVSSAGLSPLQEDEYFWRDIIGSRVVTEEGQYLGRIESIFPTGSNDVYVCKDGEKEIMLPGILDVIKKIDVENKHMVIRLLPGLE